MLLCEVRELERRVEIRAGFLWLTLSPSTLFLPSLPHHFTHAWLWKCSGPFWWDPRGELTVNRSKIRESCGEGARSE
jgi:hypothetical protein